MPNDATGASPLVSIVLPCLNEAAALPGCLARIGQVLTRHRIDGEIVVCDNASTDDSAAIAERAGARVVREPERGYGHAYLTGFAAARGRYLIMADADGTYDFDLIPVFLEKLFAGSDFVTGSRYLSATGSRHITFSHRFFGNPLLTAILNYLFNVRYTDVYCGYRAFTRETYARIKPVSTGMEFNLELAINAWRAGVKIMEIPIELGPRLGESKLSTLRDGWRSLRMMLIYSPNKIFLWPGCLLLGAGLLLHLLLLGFPQAAAASAGTSGVLAIIFCAVGFQIIALGLTAKTYSWANRFEADNAMLRSFYRRAKLETGLILGLLTFAAGAIILGWQLVAWYGTAGALAPAAAWISLAATMVNLGCQTVFFSLFISALSMKKTAAVTP